MTTTEQISSSKIFGSLSKAMRDAFETYRDQLPSYPQNGICPHCGKNDYLLAEAGYDRFTRVDYEDGWCATTNGWDDITECGEASWLECQGCYAAFAVPEDISWN